MDYMVENPFSDEELSELYEKQKSKVPFELKKTAKRDDSKEFMLSVKGDFIPEHCFEIWDDDFIVYFNSQARDEGHGYARNIFSSINSFKDEVIKAFRIREQLQLRFF